MNKKKKGLVEIIIDSLTKATNITVRHDIPPVPTIRMQVPSLSHYRGTPDRLEILWICNDNTANNPYNIVHGINKHTKHHATLIQSKTGYLKYPTDGTIMADTITKKDFETIFQNADVIHLNEPLVSGEYPCERDHYFQDNTRSNMFSLPRPGQKIFRHSNGTYYRNHTKIIEEWCFKHNVINTVSTPDLLYLGSQAIWLPQPIPFKINKLYEFAPAKYKCGDTIRISHSPTNRKIKSTDDFLKITKQLSDRYDLEVVLLEGLPHDECMNLRRTCHINYDQMFLGAYGVASLESLAIGQINIVGIHNIHEMVPDHPFVGISYGTEQLRSGIETAIDILENDRTEFLHYGLDWLETYHRDKSVVEYLIKLYLHAGMWK